MKKKVSLILCILTCALLVAGCNVSLTKQNKNFKISMSKKRIKDCDIQTICQMKQDHPLLSAREAGRLTGHSHSTILSVWREFGLA